jgi:hypothetical protein
VPGERLRVGRLDLVPHDETAASLIATACATFGRDRWAELIQAALLNAPDNPWLVVTVNVGDLDWCVQTDLSGLPAWCEVDMWRGSARLSLRMLRIRNELRPAFRLFSCFVAGNAADAP